MANPPIADEATHDPATATDPAEDRYAAALAELEAAMLAVHTDGDGDLAELRDALDLLPEFAPLLAEDPAALELRILAELALARAQLNRGDRYAAAATLDSCLEALGDIPLDEDHLGPRLGALINERVQVQRARGVSRLRVECALPCRVLIDERNIGEVSSAGSARELSLALGDHRVWIMPLDTEARSATGAAPLRATLSLDSAGELVTLRFPVDGPGAAPPAPAGPPAGDLMDDLDPRRAPGLSLGGLPQGRGTRDGGATSRVAPRWAELTTLALGGAALVAGATLWALDSRCPGGGEIADVAACPQLYDTRKVGVALTAAGLAAALTGGVLIVVDETRVGDRRGQRVSLTYTRSF